MLPRVEIVPAGPDYQPVLENLLELYIHDFSEIVPVDVGEDGRFGYADLSRYGREPGHHAFLARLDGKLAGFALVKRLPNQPDAGNFWDMTEFFVLRRYRRSGAGTELAKAIWKLCPGAWTVRVRAENRNGLGFWESAITTFTGRRIVAMEIVIKGVAWRHFAFLSPG
jgi:predicted acetyltransferase